MGGKLKKIDELLQWMYDKDILTKTEKAKKDRIFMEYHRYYNDGDLPRGSSKKYDIHPNKQGGSYKHIDLNDYNPSKKNQLETDLENKLNEFVKSILSKYLPKIDRADFRIDRLISSLETAIKSSDINLSFWVGRIALPADNQISDSIEELHSHDEDSVDFRKICTEIRTYLSDVLESTKKIKQLRIVS